MSGRRCQSRRARGRQERIHRRRHGFTLIELLVVVAVIGLLLGMLLPAMSKARAGARLTACRANLQQLGIAVILYAEAFHERIPRGPTCTGPFDFVCADYATNQLWIGATNEIHPLQPIGLETLGQRFAPEKGMLFCPADDSSDPEEELPRIGSELDAYSSYLYRQVDQLPPNRSAGNISRLGVNVVDGQKVPVEALALDANSFGPGPMRRTNHQAKKVNVLYRDGSVQTFANEKGIFSIPAETFASPLDIFARLDQILINADYGYRNDPREAPQLNGTP